MWMSFCVNLCKKEADLKIINKINLVSLNNHNCCFELSINPIFVHNLVKFLNFIQQLSVSSH